MGLFSFLGGILGLGAKGPTSEIKVSKASAVAGLPIIYGRRRVTPVKIYKTVSRHNAPHGNLSQYDHTFLPSSSNEEEVQKAYDWLHRIDVWAQGEISAIEKFWIDGDEATARRFSARPYFRALSKYGTETQAAMNALTQASDVWSAAHRGYGVAYSWVRFYNSAKKPQFTAEPEVKALIKGLRVYDPREAGQSFSNPDTWTYSNNRALVVLNYLMSPYGFNSGEDEIDLESFRIAADKCDEELTIPAVLVNTTSGPAERVWDRRYGEFVDVHFGEVYPGYREEQTGTSQARWVADAVIDPKQDVIRNIKTLLEGFGWSLPWSNGRHRLVLEDVVDAPVMTFTDADIVGGWTMEHGAREGRWNRITLEFANANKDYEQDAVSWPLLDSATYAAFKAEDQGADLHTNETLSTITDYYQAQAYAEFLVRKSRVGTRIEGISLGRKALLLEPGDVILLDYIERGLNGLWFIVEKVSVTAYLEVEADLTLYDPTVYGGEPLEQEPLNTIGDAPDLWSDPLAPEDLQLVSFHEENADGTMISGIDVNWDAPLSTGSIERFELRWRKTGDATFTGQRYLGRDSTATRIAGLVDDTSYDVQLTYWTQRGQESVEAEQTITLPASPSRFGEIEDGATRNVFLGAYDDMTTYVRGDIVTYEGSGYVFTAPNAATGVEPTNTTYWSLFASAGAPVAAQYSAYDPPSNPQLDTEWHDSFNPAADIYMRQRVAGGNWTEAIRIVGEDGAAGSDGNWVDYRFKRAATEPAAPTGNSPSGWYDAPPAGSDHLWMSRATRNGAGTVIGSWSTPVRLTGEAGLSLEVQYSVNGSTSWHAGFAVGDLYMRQRIAGESWSAAMRIVGEDGADGSNGTNGSNGSDGNWVDYRFRRAASAPGTPSGNNPSGWSDAPPAGTTPLWMSKATKTLAGQLLGSWSTPVRLSGEDGASGLTINASPSSHTVACTSDGTPKNGEFDRFSQISLFAGNSNVASSASYSISKSGCTATVSGSGLVTFSGMEGDTAYADVTATYAGVSLTVRITLAKSRDGVSAVYARGDVYPSSATDWSSPTLPGTLALALPGGGTVQMSARLNFQTSGFDTQYMLFQHRKAGTTTWNSVGAQKSQAADIEDGSTFMNVHESYAAPASAEVWEFRLRQRHAGDGATLLGNPGSFSVQLV
jgi:hypothetical protein